MLFLTIQNRHSRSYCPAYQEKRKFATFMSEFPYLQYLCAFLNGGGRGI